ncbi:hypothetical protein [Devosia marina]|uniref:Uncharacterized protein n=1 Tax=Devosia marina TaxID=2683198 RepID=A0A7X3FT27_9HYPH|nr:hypothetical protein [Devosia marina]MVT00136.1 hypothetical protein [Devosia marina]
MAVGQTLLESRNDHSMSFIGQERTGKWALEFYHAPHGCFCQATTQSGRTVADPILAASQVLMNGWKGAVIELSGSGRD